MTSVLPQPNHRFLDFFPDCEDQGCCCRFIPDGLSTSGVFTNEVGFPAPAVPDALARFDRLSNHRSYNVPQTNNSGYYPHQAPAPAQSQVQQPVKQPVAPPVPEEQNLGGVSQTALDYEIPDMAEYITLCAYGIFDYADSLVRDEGNRGRAVKDGVDKFEIVKSVGQSVLGGPHAVQSPQYRATIKQLEMVLKSARLPHQSIMVGIYYLSERVGRLRLEAKDLKDEMVFPYIILALLLGSKFSDDNTFNNRSWSEISSLSFEAIQTLEIEWVRSVGFSLFPEGDKLDDVWDWLELFHEYLHKVKGKELRHGTQWTVLAKRQLAQCQKQEEVCAPVAIDTSCASVSPIASRHYGPTGALTPPDSESSSDGHYFGQSTWSLGRRNEWSANHPRPEYWGQMNTGMVSPALSEHGAYSSYADSGMANSQTWGMPGDPFPVSGPVSQHYMYNSHDRPLEAHQSYASQFNPVRMATGCGPAAFQNQGYYGLFQHNTSVR